MSDSFNIISLWVPLAGVFIALVAVIVSTISLRSQIKRSKFTQSVDLLLKFERRFFDNDRVIKARQKAARSLQSGGDKDVEPILDFFETLGMLVRKDAFDREMVWNTFFYWFHNYWSAAREYVATKRKDDPTTWEEYAFLDQCMSQIEKRMTHCTDSDLIPSEADIASFLKEELEP